MKKGYFSSIFALAFASAIALASMSAFAQNADVAIDTDLSTTTQTIKDHALDGKLTVFSRQNGEVVGVIFENSKDGQLVAFPKSSLDAFNEATSARGDVMPMAPPTVTITWVRDMPGGGSVYSASIGDTVVGWYIVQANGHVEYVPI